MTRAAAMPWRRRLVGGAVLLVAVAAAAGLWFWQAWTQPALPLRAGPGPVS